MWGSQLIIGSAQFGSDYGAANQSGKVAESEVEHILDFASQHGVHCIDTAPVYGESEYVLGKFLKSRFDIITKIPKIDPLVVNIKDFVVRSYETSLNKLGSAKIYTLMVHHADDLLSESGDELYRGLAELKQAGAVDKIGVSVYSPTMASAVLKRYTFDVIQFPFNILDQRFLKDNYLQVLKKQNIELHARSVFLQGILLMDLVKLHHFFNPVKPSLVEFRDMCQSASLSIKQALLQFVSSFKEIDYMVVGCDGLEQFKELVSLLSNDPVFESSQFNKFACQSLDMINPARWVFS